MDGSLITEDTAHYTKNGGLVQGEKYTERGASADIQGRAAF
jgi:hypothetical protein